MPVDAGRLGKHAVVNTYSDPGSFGHVNRRSRNGWVRDFLVHILNSRYLHAHTEGIYMNIRTDTRTAAACMHA